ncbi:hypothetical protein [Flavobacterium panacagri]|uniref:hypothetical protein n=1 Tax=Flavobacterium panacagri TaxID=3034146 RepID=UPI0025A599EC|nr:hypothetical protein [Flavobacterium panacagri]
MQDDLQVPKTLHFSSFRYINLIYSLPLIFFFIIGFAKVCFYVEPILEKQLPLWLSTIIYIFSLLFFTAIIVKIFFILNLRRISLYIDHEGFIVNNKLNKKKYWSQVKSYAFPKDKYESRSNEAASTVMLSFGFMKMSIINCSTWTLFNKRRREEEKEAFAQFKQAVVHFC